MQKGRKMSAKVPEVLKGNQFIKNQLPAWVAPLALLFLSVLIYGPFLPRLGFYWDDWVFVWIRTFQGLEGLVDAFNVTSPIRGWIETALNPILGVNPLAWQAFSLMTRWLAAVAFWWFLYIVWPERRAQALFASAMLIVYPGYSQQPLAMTYYFYWVFAAFFFLSFAFMALSLKQEKPIWWLFSLSLVFSALQLVSMEYLAGLELLRPLVLWVVFGRLFTDKAQVLKKTFLLTLPYLAVLCGYVYWRLFLFGESLYSPVLFSQIQKSPLEILTSLVVSILDTIKQVNLDAWLKVIALPPLDEWGFSLSIIYLVILGLTLCGSLFFLMRLDRNEKAPVDWLVFGLAGMLLAGLPFFVAGLKIRIIFPEDRFTLAYMPLVGLFLAGLIWQIRSSAQRVLIAGLMVALAAGYQVQVLQHYSDDWKMQRSFAWQLAWRAPNLQHGSLILSEDYDTFYYNDDEALSAIVKWMYHQTSPSDTHHDMYTFISGRLVQDLPRLLEGSQNSNPILVTRFSPPGCLRVFHPEYDTVLLSLPNHKDVSALTGMNLPILPDLTRQAIPLSNPSITTGGDFFASIPEFFHPEPPRGWCYTFQKADLARQQGDWEEVVRLGDQDFNKLFFDQREQSEYLLFVEAYARLGRMREARLLTRRVAEFMPLLRPALCDIWQRVPDISPEQVNEIRQSLEVCPVVP